MSEREEYVLWAGDGVRVIRVGPPVRESEFHLEVESEGEWVRPELPARVCASLAGLAIQYLALGVMQEG